MKCHHCGKSFSNSRVDPEQAARDLLEGFNKGLKGEELLKYARKSLPKKRKSLRGDKEA